MSTSTCIGWTDERVEILKKLWAEGLSCSQIANRLGGTTRNAVIGKVTRLESPPRATSSRTHTARAFKPSRSSVKATKPPRQPVERSRRPLADIFETNPEPFAVEPDLVVPIEARKGLIDLEKDDCRWPIGDPQHADFHFCNRHKVPGLPYCEFHARRAYQPRKSRVQSVFAGPAPQAARADDDLVGA